MAGTEAEQRPLSLTREAMELFAEYQRAGDPPLLTAAVAGFRAALAAALASGGPDIAAYHNNLGYALHELAEATGDPAVPGEAVRCHRAALAATATDDPHRVAYLCTLSSGLRAQYQSTGDPDLLVEAVAVAREAIDSPSGDQPGPATQFAVLAGALEDWYEYRPDEAVLGDLIEAYRSAAGLAEFSDEPGLPAHWNSVSSWLRERFERTADAATLAEAIRAARQAVAAVASDDAGRGGYLNNLQITLELEFERTGNLDTLSESVDAARQALAAAPPGHRLRALCLGALASAVGQLYDQTGDDELLAEYVQASRDVVTATPVGHLDHALALHNLGQALSSAFARGGDLARLDEAVRLARASIAATPADDPALANRLAALSSLLDTVVAQTGNAALLGEAVAAARAALAAMPPDHPDRALLLDDLGAALTSEFVQTRNSTVLAEAVRVRRAALAAVPHGHTSRAIALVNLATSVQTLAGRTGDVWTTVEAAELTAEAVDALPEDHPVRAFCLYRLARIYSILNRRLQDPDFLDRAIECARQSLAATPVDHADHPARRATLGGLLLERSADGSDKKLLAEGLLLARQALAATRPDDPDYGDRLNLLGWALYARYQVTGDAAAVAEARQCMYDAARHPLASPRLRINAYRRAAELAPLVGESAQEALACIEAAVDLLPAVLPGQLDRPDQEHEIGVMAHLAVHAAEAAISAGRPDRAIELLERTRGVLVAGELDRRAGHDHHAPLTIAGLGDIASEGPVVYLNAGILRCDALALVAAADSVGSARAPAVRHIPLAVLPSEVEDKAGRLLTLVGLEPADEELDPADPAVHREMVAILGWIREHVTGPVLAAFGYDRGPADETSRPRIWWCPVGHFIFLPLHATCLDEVVSSYAFTARSLRQARSRPPPDTGDGPLVIAVPDAPGTTPLPGADLEAEVIAGIFPDALRLAQPTKEAVLDALPGHPVVHFACHGAVDPDEPGQSQLFLEDHQRAPLTVADIGALRLPGGLAFLSACETAVTNGNLSNEAVHLTGAFQLAGYRDVVGTLWQVGDLASARLVGHFYRALTASGSGHRQPAIALNAATRRLRDSYPSWPAFWAGHVHVGP